MDHCYADTRLQGFRGREELMLSQGRDEMIHMIQLVNQSVSISDPPAYIKVRNSGLGVCLYAVRATHIWVERE